MTESEEGRTIPYEALVNALFENYEEHLRPRLGNVWI